MLYALMQHPDHDPIKMLVEWWWYLGSESKRNRIARQSLTRNVTTHLQTTFFISPLTAHIMEQYTLDVPISILDTDLYKVWPFVGLSIVVNTEFSTVLVHDATSSPQEISPCRSNLHFHSQGQNCVIYATKRRLIQISRFAYGCLFLWLTAEESSVDRVFDAHFDRRRTGLVS